MRLDKYISDALQLSRAQARQRIAKGTVSVNGQVCRQADRQITDADTVQAGGGQLDRQQFVYIMLNKPQGVVSASTDRRDTTVVDLVAGEFPRRQLFPAGRLDKTSTGFVLLTDDGAFAHRILSPRRHVEKEYLVTLDTPLTPEMCQGFAQGVTLADGQKLAPARAEPVEGEPLQARVTLTQGVYHQIKRMFGVYGAGVDGLHRLRMGGLWLDDSLAPGAWRQLFAAEFALLEEKGAAERVKKG